MAVFALWSAPRARSTAFFRSMAERGDMTVLHEPFCNLRDYGETDAGARTFYSPLSLLAWLRDETHDMRVFLKDHPPATYVQDVVADRRFLAEARHAFLIRRPEEIAASSYALHPGMNIIAIGLEMLCEVQAAIRDAGGDSSVVIDSDDLVARPEATMAAYCAAVDCPSSRGRSPGSPMNGPSGAAHHRPFYEQLYAQRLDVAPWQQDESP